MLVKEKKLVDGSSCVICGQYFTYAKKAKKSRLVSLFLPEHPVVCQCCWEDYSGCFRTELGIN